MLKTLDKAKAKAMEKVTWKRSIFQDLPGTKESLDLRISFCSQETIPGYGMHEGSDHGNGSPIIEPAKMPRERMRLVFHQQVQQVQHLTARPYVLVLLEKAGIFEKVLCLISYHQLSSAIISYHQLSSATALRCTEASEKLSQALEAHQESKAAVAEEWDPWLSRMHHMPG